MYQISMHLLPLYGNHVVIWHPTLALFEYLPFATRLCTAGYPRRDSEEGVKPTLPYPALPYPALPYPTARLDTSVVVVG